MKKTLIAVATASMLVGGAVAQSNVVIYGELDAGIGQRYSGEDVGMISNYAGTSRWGLRGSEDLGNGLKANFNFESGSIELGDGSVGGSGSFNRQAWVGLSGSFGSLMVGRTTTPQNRVMGTFDLNGTADGSSALKAIGLAANGNLGGSRQNAQVQYATPNFNGLQLRVAYATNDNTETDKAFAQAAVSYKTGGLTIGGVIHKKMNDAQRTGYALGAKYDFGSIVVSGFYTRDETEDTRTNLGGGDGFGLGIAAPIGAFTVGLQAAYLNHDNNAVDGATAYELFGNYSLSKRTKLYAAAGYVNDEAERRGGYKEDTTFGIGILHKF
ncbi:porin [Lampropedia cohaerens]|nr:porin [Lampropedia cohaerens]